MMSDLSSQVSSLPPISGWLIRLLHRWVLSKMTRRHPDDHPFMMVVKSFDLTILGMIFLAALSLIYPIEGLPVGAYRLALKLLGRRNDTPVN